MATTQQVVVVVPAATSTPIQGTVTGNSSTEAFTPQLGRDMYITLSGTWTGTVRVQRSTDGGATWNNITIGGGQPWGLYTTNADEVVDTPTDGDATYRLGYNVSTGSVTYRLGQ